MRGQAKIDTPYPSIQETAKLFQVPQFRVSELVNLAGTLRKRTSAKKARQLRASPARKTVKSVLPSGSGATVAKLARAPRPKRNAVTRTRS